LKKVAQDLVLFLYVIKMPKKKTTAQQVKIRPIWSPCRPGLPDGIFSNQKSQFLCIWEGLGMENCGISPPPIGIFCSDLGYVITI
jgi:hypothetical protein